jgi:hypothetical protein
MNPAYEDIRKLLVALKGSRSAVQRRWDFYRNDVDRPPYFPYLKNESSEHYRTRLKIPVAWCGAAANRAANYFCTPPIKTTFTVGGKEDDAKAQEAAATWGEIAKYNEFDSFRVDLFTASGVGGNGYAKERFHFYNEQSGTEFKTGRFRGRVLIDTVNEVYVYRVRLGLTTAFIEAWVEQDGEHKIFDEYAENADPDRLEYVEVIIPAVYDTSTGKRLDKSSWTIWRNKDILWGPREIPHLLPIQRYANLVSRPEGQNGISDIEWAIPLANLVNHVMTGAARATQYHGEPKAVARGVSEESKVKWGGDQMIYLPESGASGELPDIKLLTWDQNIEAAKTLYRDGVSMIAAIGGFPQHMLQDLEGAGKVVSGVALKILYAPLNQVCLRKEAGFKGAEIKTIKASLSQLAYYNNQPGYFDDVEVDVQYNPDRTPRDMDAEFDSDNKKKLAGVLNLVDLVMKYIPGYDTREKAIKFLEERAAETKRLRELGLMDGSFTWNEGDEAAPRDEEPAEV